MALLKGVAKANMWKVRIEGNELRAGVCFELTSQQTKSYGRTISPSLDCTTSMVSYGYIYQAMGGICPVLSSEASEQQHHEGLGFFFVVDG